jgi:choline-sulfatase
MKREQARWINLLMLVVFGLTIIEGVALTVCRPQTRGLRAWYYDNQEWKGNPAFEGLDPEISTEAMEARRPEGLRRPFSVEWTGYLYIPAAGEYTFFTNSDDGSWLWIDDNLVVDNGGPHGLEMVRGRVHLLKGLHSVRFRYFQIGGIAVLRALWQPKGSLRSALPADLLFPPTTDRASFWMYQTGRALLPWLLWLWGLAVVSLFIAAALTLRRTRRTEFTRHIAAFPTFRTLIGHTLHRLFVQPLAFFGRQFKKPQAWYWLLVVVYTLIIYLTLSYARDVSDYLTGRFGDDVFTHITVVMLLVSGAGFLLYLLWTRTHLVARLLVFGVIVGLYSYMLSPEVRDSVHAWTRLVGYTGEFLASLDIYPIVAAEKVHFLEYGLLGLLLCKTLCFHIKDKTAYLLALALVYLIGMTDEGIQWALPNRVGEYRDIWLNIVSGALAIVAVWLVIRPRVFRRHWRWSSLRPLLYTLAVAGILTGVFLQVVHGFGQDIFMPDTGAQFVSNFSEYELLDRDNRLMRRSEGEIADDVSYHDRWVYNYEARRHQYLRDLHYKDERFFESFYEQEILKTYFRAYLRRNQVQLFDYDLDAFAITPDPNEHVFYVSAAHELAITSYGQQAMWTTIALAAAALCVLATFVPVSEEQRLLDEQHGVAPEDRRRCERLALRPLFVLGLLAAVGVPLYLAFAPEPEPEHTNLIILTLESSQPDYLSAYGYPKNTTPYFDQLAEDGVLFSNMVAASSWTIPSLATMLTGVSPNIHGIDARGKLMDPDIPTLFESLEERGYVIGDTSYTLTEPSINSVYKKKDISPEASLESGRSEESYLLSWMEANRDKPFFGWVHLHTTHLPYRASPPYNKMFLEDIDPAVLEDEEIQLVLSNIIVRKGEVEFDQDRHAPVIRALFTQTLRQQDAKVGKVLMKLDELGLRDNTLVIVTADHGDELLEHGFIGHASTSWDSTVYEDLLHIPLVVYSPGKLPQGQRIDTQVRMIDIMPTVLDILNIPPPEPIQGQSFLPVIRGDDDFPKYAFAATTPCGYSCPSRLVQNRLRAVRTNEWKLIETYTAETDETTCELYNLQDDPAETANVIEQHPEIAAQFKAELQRWKDAPADYPYQEQQSEEQHYLDMDVEVRPIVLFPKVGTVITPETHDKRVLVKWIGDDEAEYLIEYDVGEGGYHMTGELEVVGTEQWFGPFPDDIWQALPLYNPWRFRIIPKQYPQYPSEWITFEMQVE